MKKALDRESEDQIKLFDLPENPESLERRHRFSPIHRALWTEHKARLIGRYLRYFVFITKHGVYIDGFAGPQRPDQPDSWAAKLVLENQPRWIRNFFLCDDDPKKASLLKRLRDTQPNTKGRTIDIACADFNSHVDTVLATDKIREKTATFCLLDQRTFECNWSTVQKIARRKAKRKIEIFYFVPTGWLKRSIRGLKDAGHTMNRWWGGDNWTDLQYMTNPDIAETFRQRFEQELDYAYAYRWPIYDERQNGQRIMYYMIHATDHYEAPKLMARAYKGVTNRDEPPEQLLIEF